MASAEEDGHGAGRLGCSAATGSPSMSPDGDRAEALTPSCRSRATARMAMTSEAAVMS